MMKVKFCITLLSLLCLPLVVMGQTGTITGRVTDNRGEVLPGANIALLDLLMGTSTNLNGEFTIDQVPPGVHTIEARFIGYLTARQEVTVVAEEQVVVNFQLQAEELMLNVIVITGTRTRGRSVIDSATPIDRLDAKELDQQGSGDMTETLKNLVPSYTATPLTGDGAAFVRSTSLRGLPPDDALFLVNSKRRHRSALIAHFGAAMNVGAHAADIGHIPSIALKNVEILRDGASAQYGSDAIAGVMNFLLKDASKGIEVQTQAGQWYEGETDYKVAANAGFPLTQKGFINLSAEYAFSPELSRGVQDATAQAAIDAGVPDVPTPAMIWGRPESSGLRTVWNAGLNLSDQLQAYSFGNFSDTYGDYSFFYRPPNRNDALRPLPRDPNNPAAGNFCWCDDFPGGFTPRFEGFQQDLSMVVGLKGALIEKLSYDLSGSYGTNRLDYKLRNSLNASWGPNSKKVFKPGDLKQEEINVGLDLSYEFSENINLAGGVEWRQETYTMFEGDEQSWKAGPWANVGLLINPQTNEKYFSPGLTSNGFAGTSPELAGSWDGQNYAVYVDAEWDVTEALLVQGALRYEDYTDFGTTTDGKVAARYKVSNELTLRGAVSTGFRAPTPGQANVTAISTSFDGRTGLQVQEGTVRPTDSLAVRLGGKALIPEDAFNISLGLASRLTPNISTTIDYYRIEVKDRISKSRSLPVTGNPRFSELAFYTNALSTLTQGVDVVASWSHEDMGTEVHLAYNYNETEVLDQELVNGLKPVSDETIFNLENNLPKHRASATWVQQVGKLSTTIRANFYGETVDERGDREEVSPEVLVDLELSYPVINYLTLIAGANNVFDNYPDEIETRLAQGMPYPRRTPIGYLGGMVYLRAVYRL